MAVTNYYSVEGEIIGEQRPGEAESRKLRFGLPEQRCPGNPSFSQIGKMIEQCINGSEKSKIVKEIKKSIKDVLGLLRAL